LNAKQFRLRFYRSMRSDAEFKQFAEWEIAKRQSRQRSNQTFTDWITPK